MGNNHPNRLSTAGYSISKSSYSRSKGGTSSNSSTKDLSLGNYAESDQDSGMKSPSVKRFTVWCREMKGRRANNLKASESNDYITTSDHGSSSEAHSVVSDRGLSRSDNVTWIDGRERIALDMDGHVSTIPVDSEEIEQSKVNHSIYKYILRGNHITTLSNPKRILEIGTKSGIWTREMAKEFPKAKLTAMDIQNEIDSDGWPSNAEFVLGDILSPNGLPFKSDQFDYIQMRQMRYFIPDEAWPKVMTELHRICKPGGYIELLDGDFDFQVQSPETKQFRNTFASILSASGVKIDAICHLDTLMQITGLTEIKKQQFNIPVGDWGEAIGQVLGRTIQYYFSSFQAIIAHFDIMNVDEYNELYNYCFEHLDELRGYATIHAYVGRKPLGKSGKNGTLAVSPSPKLTL